MARSVITTLVETRLLRKTSKKKKKRGVEKPTLEEAEQKIRKRRGFNRLFCFVDADKQRGSNAP